ncbi:MAG: hypothetical protein Tsb0013_12550 [Phycisphaerales bacterium]
MRRTPHHSTTGTRTGFTLLETMLAMTITLVGILAVLQAQRAFLFNNLWSSNAASAAYLASEVRELTRALPRHDRFSGGLYFTTPGDTSTLTGFGPEPNESTPDDFDDLDDFDGAVFGDATALPEGFTLRNRFTGPIGADGNILEAVDWDAVVVEEDVEGQLEALPMQGWTQCIKVELVDPYDYALPIDLASYNQDVRDINDYPVRVTVYILFQNQWTENAPALTQVSWVVPP